MSQNSDWDILEYQKADFILSIYIQEKQKF